ncbi:hypothetical protein ACTD5D_30975 [Nocardia takedensis]|uniref:hypothetical protein n=1 Tax=Nocardia takedensis TaxID=259390 RepID=UPI003F7599FF
MSRNSIRAVDLTTWIARRRMSRAERTEFDVLRAVVRTARAAEQARVAAHSLESRAAFRPELVLTAPGVGALAEFSVAQLIAEHAELVRLDRDVHRMFTNGEQSLRPAVEALTAQQDALREEFAHRRRSPHTLSPLDRARLDADLWLRSPYREFSGFPREESHDILTRFLTIHTPTEEEK